MHVMQRFALLLVGVEVLGVEVLGVGGEPWSDDQQQAKFMRQCIALAQEAVESGGSPYGALIADPESGEVVATGRNDAALNPIWHGETAAIANLSAILGGETSVYEVAPKLELYTTAEPCAMCMGAIAWSGFGRVYFGTSIPFITGQGQNQIQIRATTISDAANFTNSSVFGGVLANETNPLYESYESTAHHHHDHHDCSQCNHGTDGPKRRPSRWHR